MLLYVTIVLKPLVPVVDDWWQHEFNPIKHQIHVHSIYGSNHLQKELAKENSNGNSKNQNALKSQDQVSFHVSPEIGKYDSTLNKINIQHFSFISGKLPFVLISNQGPPPKFS
jgi:hypothetical protein